MLKTALSICFAICTTGFAFARDPATSSSAAEPSTSFVVQLTEYHVQTPIAPSMSAAEILEMVTTQSSNEKSEPVETIRISTLNGVESSVQFGRRIHVTVSKTKTNRGQVLRNTEVFNLGTIIRVTTTAKNGKVGIALALETSRVEDSMHQDDSNQDSPPNISQTQIETKQLLDLGKPSLVGSLTNPSSSIIVVTVNEQ